MMKYYCLLILTLLSAFASYAGLVISPTRIVFPAEQRERSFILASANPTPVIVQAWIDDGDVANSLDKAVSPFIVLPPIFRLEPNGIESLRIIYTGDALPSDRESLFWLNLYEVPALPSRIQNQHTTLMLALKTQVKLFFRPANLTANTSDILNQLRFSLVERDGQWILRSQNPTPFYVTLSELVIIAKEKEQPLTIDMLAPFSEQYSQGITVAIGGAKLRYSLINDQGHEVRQRQMMALD